MYTTINNVKRQIFFIFVHIVLFTNIGAMEETIAKPQKHVLGIIIVSARTYPDPSFSLFKRQPYEFLSSSRPIKEPLKEPRIITLAPLKKTIDKS